MKRYGVLVKIIHEVDIILGIHHEQQHRGENEASCDNNRGVSDIESFDAWQFHFLPPNYVRM